MADAGSKLAELAEFQAGKGGLVAELADLSTLDYAQRRKEAAKELGIRVGELDKAVAEQRKKADGPDAKPPFAAIEPWGEPVSGAGILAELARALASHVVLPTGAATTISLWTLHAHTHDSADISPILGVTSPAPECGKTTLLTLLGAVVPRPLPASNITSAALFRAVEKWSPTLLVDEADTFLRDSDELRGIINSGHNKASAFVIRTVGDDYDPQHFKTWAPKALASIGKLAPTIASRAIHIELRRKGPGEQVKALRPDRMAHLHVLARRAARWAADNMEALRAAEPDMPATLTGRRGDNWRHMLAIAALAGGKWPERARRAAEAMAADDDNEVAGTLLLGDIRAYVEQQKAEHPQWKINHVWSRNLVAALHELLDRPWPEWGKRNKPISESQVARLLKGFKIRPRIIRIGDSVARGYLLEQFADAFTHYLPPFQTVTPLQTSDINGLQAVQTVTGDDGVTARSPSNPLENNKCNGVTAQKGEASEVGVSCGQGNGPTGPFPLVCEHCGAGATPGNPVTEYLVEGDRCLLHAGCESEWLGGTRQ